MLRVIVEVVRFDCFSQFAVHLMEKENLAIRAHLSARRKISLMRPKAR